MRGRGKVGLWLKFRSFELYLTGEDSSIPKLNNRSFRREIVLSFIYEDVVLANLIYCVLLYCILSEV